jgi:hypothetical protein
MQVLRILIITGLAMTAGTATAILLNGKPVQALGRRDCDNTVCQESATSCTFQVGTHCKLNPHCDGSPPCN